MHQEKYSLTWHNYSDHLRSMMKELMMNEDFSDVTLVTEDKKHLKANANILSLCSPVFKDIFKKDMKSSLIIFLRGIQHSEMESIIQYIYLGEAKVYEERIDEFVAVAKSLEIKELCNAKTGLIDEIEDENSSCDPTTSTENFEEQSVQSDLMKMQAPQERQRRVQTKLEGAKYACDLCDYQATYQINLTNHIRSKHEGVKYACDQCDHQASHPSNLVIHIQSKHEGVKYACDQCEYKASSKSNLNVHIKSKHEGFRYACDQCDYQTTLPSSLTRHIQSKHEYLPLASFLVPNQHIK